MSRYRGSIEERLKSAQVTITNVLSEPELQSVLIIYGYTAERLREGQALRERALALHQQQRNAYSDLTLANETLAAAQKRARTDYMHDVKIARVALAADRSVLKRLHLDGERKQTRSGWLTQAQHFYTVALSDDIILSRLDAYGISEERLEAGRRQMDTVDAGVAVQHKHRGEAKKATRVRDEAMAALEAWMSEFRQSVRWVVKSQPQHLEKLDMAALA